MSNFLQRILRKSKIEIKSTDSDSKDFESIDSLDTRSTRTSSRYAKTNQGDKLLKFKSPKPKTTEPKVKEFTRGPLSSGFPAPRI
ncbi:hypothetical protein CLIB1444_02S11056 [[Candida] jaroonii]|uniref:Uncharacterized protein n=1 Tax=[Candida] jaroonii TaxID=467808 RepID=A0ACA9Y3Q2_9ASCO|nr:hypothetical protein CLIB1444_02S11056 [[Candida] jaroonii]